MTKSRLTLAACLLCWGLAVVVGFSAWGQAPKRKPDSAAAQDNSPRGQHSRPEPGMVLPPFVRDQLKLSDDQKKKIADLESDVKTKLKGILTDDQMKQFEDLLRRGPPRPRDDQEGGGKGPNGGGPDERRGPPGADDRRGGSSSLGDNDAPNVGKVLDPAEVPKELQAIASQFHKNVKVSFTKTDMIVESNGLPDHETGHFPNANNPNTIRAQNYKFFIPLEPRKAESTTPLPMGPIGVAINGVPFYNQYNAEGQNAVEGPTAEVFDSCCGHPDPMGRYHYHKYPVCVHNPFKDQEKTGKHSPLIGYAFDGYAIYGPNGEDGKPPHDLDECNGHTDSQHGYHYHVTAQAPYILGAYRGRVERANFDHPPL